MEWTEIAAGGRAVSRSKHATLLVGLLQVRSDPWKSIYENGQLPAWIKRCPASVEIVNIYGKTPNFLVRSLDIAYEKMRWSPVWQGPINFLNRFLTKFLRRLGWPKFRVESNKVVTNLFVEVSSMHLTLPIVEVALFRYFLDSSDAKFLYMSNTSSYVNVEKLLELLTRITKNEIYGGTMMEFADVRFASGANRILSRDTVQFLVNEFKNWDFQYMDDVSLGKLLAGTSTNEVNIPSMTFSNKDEIDDADLAKLKSNIHFRLKSGPLNARNDIALMHYLHSTLVNDL